jgi:hypothetical protein
MRRLFHPFRMLTRLVTLAWLWRNRHDIVRWARFGLRLATNREELQRDDIVAELRARAALTMDPRTRTASDLDIERIGDGLVVVRTHLGKPTAQVARDVLERVPGVRTVDVVDLDGPAESSSGEALTAATSGASALPSSAAANGS